MQSLGALHIPLFSYQVPVARLRTSVHVFVNGQVSIHADGNFILTQEGKDKLEEELHFLETEKRAEIGERIKVAREFGDISENSEYDDARTSRA